MRRLIISSLLLASSVAPVLAGNAADNFQQNDPIGWMMAVIAMGVVFCALVILFLCFKYLYPLCTWCGLQFMKTTHKKKQIEQVNDRRAIANKARQEARESIRNEEELAASIAVALFLNEDGMHDRESGVLTLTPSSSAWTGAGQNQKRSPQRHF